MKAFSTFSAVALALSTLVSAQTRVVAPENKYTPEEDVKIGREAAAQARRELPLLRDERVDSYIDAIGRRLAAAIRSDLRHRQFEYSFTVVNVRDINAFALPGGPMFLNRGMIEAAKTEGEIAGVMAHEISHVALRHGTAQAGKAAPYQVGSIIGAVVGAIIGGRTGDIVNQAAQFGLGTAFLRYGREYERQSDIEGAHMMARAGYDPRDMANMFRTIEQQGGGSGPEWLSDHPNPGNRYNYITEEARLLRVENPVRDTRAFEQVRARLKSLPRAPSMEEVSRNAKRTGADAPAGNARPTGSVAVPSGRYTEYKEGDVFRVSVPSNWRELPSSNSVTFAPEGAYGERNGQNVFTHGVEIGITRSEEHDLRTATDELIESLAQSNPALRRTSQAYRRSSLGGRTALQATLANRSEATGEQETIQVTTAVMRDGNLVYAIAVAPADEYARYQPAFTRVLRSIRFNK